VSFPADIWSTCATLFQLASGRLPFECPNPMAAFMAIAHDLDAPAPDVRDAAPEGLRSSLTSGFASVLKRGLERQIEARLSCADELASALHDCLVERGEELYSVFISYRVASERSHAALLYELLNNTITPAGHRVIVFLDSRRLVKGAAWEDGFVQGLLHSLIAVPLVSRGFLNPLATLAGLDSDRRDNVALELLLMQALAEASESAPQGDASSTGRHAAGLEAIYPIFIGDPFPAQEKAPVDPSAQSGTPQLASNLAWGNGVSAVRRGSSGTTLPGYPRSGNFFSDCSRLISALPDIVSPPTTAAAVSFLTARGVESAERLCTRTVRATVNELLTRQGAELWASGGVEPEEIPPDSDVLTRAVAEPTDPELDANQLGMIKAQLRALVPAIHAVVDRAHSRAAARPQPGVASKVTGEVTELPSPGLQAGGVVEQPIPSLLGGDLMVPSSPGLTAANSAEQLSYSLPASKVSIQTRVGDIGQHVGPGKVEASAESTHREEGPLSYEMRGPIQSSPAKLPFKGNA
jgi:hypothetical protein